MQRKDEENVAGITKNLTMEKMVKKEQGEIFEDSSI